MKYQDHPSIIMINENVSSDSQFKFEFVNENDIQCEILNLNSKKPGTFGDVPTKILKDSSEVCNVIVQNILNSKLLEKQCSHDKVLKIVKRLKVKSFSWPTLCHGS